MSSDRRGVLKYLIAAIGAGVIFAGERAYKIIDEFSRLAPGAPARVGDNLEDDQKTETDPAFLPGDTGTSAPTRGDQIEPPAGGTAPETPSEPTSLDPQTLACTDVRVQTWDIVATDGPGDFFTVTLVNESNTAGTVEINVEYYQTEAARDGVGVRSESVAIGGQGVREISFNTLPPSGGEYASLSVQQSCQY